MKLPGLVGSPSAFPEGLPLLRKPFPVSLGMEQLTMTSWPG